MSAMDPRKKRIHIRTDVLVNGQKRAEALDLSEDGMYVFTSHTFIEGVNISLEFVLDLDSYDMRATIRHTQHGVGFGVQFVDMDGDSASRLRNYVDTH